MSELNMNLNENYYDVISNYKIIFETSLNNFNLF